MIKPRIMEQELNYVTVTFKTKDTSTHGKPNNLEIIYEELKTDEQTCHTNLGISENEKKTPLYILVAVCLGIICVILVSVLISLSISLNTVMSEQKRENSSFNRQKEELIRERDGLNWTIGVILEYKSFPVDSYCPQKVCKPCLDDWVLFQSTCYLFTIDEYYRKWKTWQESLAECRNMKAGLVVIESQEEQEFISNHTKNYNDENHGYWIGLSKKDTMDTWMWADESNLTVTYWITQQAGNKAVCALSLPHADPLANWKETGCNMKNRWICETRALIKPY